MANWTWEMERSIAKLTAKGYSGRLRCMNVKETTGVIIRKDVAALYLHNFYLCPRVLYLLRCGWITVVVL